VGSARLPGIRAWRLTIAVKDRSIEFDYSGTDGYHHIGMIDASGGVLGQGSEMFEQQTPHILEKNELLTDSAGPGRWCGGLGVETRIRFGGGPVQLVTFGDGDIEPAFGLFGDILSGLAS
jgi:N-methylhydantoinase B